MATPDDDHWGPPPLTLRDSRFSAGRTTRPWTWRLGLFLRLTAALELLKGLAHWALLIGAGGGADPIAGASPGWLAANTAFAIADPVAAVGLWVGAPWGVAIWLIAGTGQIASSALGGPGPAAWLIIAVTLSAMTLYVALSMKARREAF
ncbi:DUF6163 family protein [Methylopila sp. M107]|uniref:DUF6163 family protein n=1 Tax=Methylopila sp. M107 TaxID=1101190 RepID=UPI000381137E|nr:DUF6163 family protein [Methylopila sp. M107]